MSPTLSMQSSRGILLTLGWLACPWSVMPSHGHPSEDAVAVSWSYEGDDLVVQASSPGHGWVCVGFNDIPSLDGARLVMAGLEDGVFVVEEHVADPPTHAERRHGAVATGLVGGRDDAGTQVRFRVPVDPEDRSLARLDPGARVWMITAWSRSDDFEHHSAARTGRWVTLPRRVDTPE